VRPVLFDLEKKGLVERIPNRGALVRGLTPQEVKEIYAVRKELEVMAVRMIPFPVSVSAAMLAIGGGRQIGTKSETKENDLRRSQRDLGTGGFCGRRTFERNGRSFARNAKRACRDSQAIRRTVHRA
jgi:hypothetical protein